MVKALKFFADEFPEECSLQPGGRGESRPAVSGFPHLLPGHEDTLLRGRKPPGTGGGVLEQREQGQVKLLDFGIWTRALEVEMRRDTTCAWLRAGAWNSGCTRSFAAAQQLLY